MSIDSTTPTRITIHPEPLEQPAGSLTRKPIQKATLGDNNSNFWGEDGFTFGDLIDLVNPLQHIPVVSTIYRELTGDTIAPGPRLIGGGVLGGVFGFAASAAEVAFEQGSGQTLGSQVAALFSGETPEGAAKPSTQTVEKVAAPSSEPVHMLEPLDMSQLEAGTLSALIPQTATPQPVQKKPDRYDAVLQLFDEEVASLTDRYDQAQALAYAQEVANNLKS